MSTVSQLTPAQLAAEQASVRVLDVREREEVAGGRIAGSINIPLGQLLSQLGSLMPGVPVVIVCQSGRRSQRAAEALAAAGFTVANLAGGMNAWVADGRPVTPLSPRSHFPP
jgi:rhodanese-related sulfurtransferase